MQKILHKDYYDCKGNKIYKVHTFLLFLQLKKELITDEYNCFYRHVLLSSQQTSTIVSKCIIKKQNLAMQVSFIYSYHCILCVFNCILLVIAKHDLYLTEIR